LQEAHKFSFIVFSMMLALSILLICPSSSIADDLAISFGDGENSNITISSDKDLKFSTFKINNPNRLVVDVKYISATPAEYLNRNKLIPKIQVSRVGNISRIILEPASGIQLTTRQDSPRSVTIIGTQAVLEKVAVIPQPAAVAVATPAPVKSTLQQKSDTSVAKPVDVSSTPKTDAKKYSGKKVSMEFDNADIRHIFRLLSEVSGENFVINDDVKGSFSIKLKDVPWEQALNIIVRNNDLAISHIGNVVEILKKEKKLERDKAENDLRLQEMKQKLEEKVAKETAEGMEIRAIQLKHASADKMAETLFIMLSQGNSNVNTGQGQQQSQQLNQGQSSASTTSDVKREFTASIKAEPNTNKIIVRDYISKIDAIEKLVKELDVPERQVLIEARIIVATAQFTRDFGVQWGVHYKDGSASLLGVNSLDTGFGGIAAAPPTSGQFSSTGGVNTGISFGTLASNIQLDMRLSAATTANTVKVIASPKIVTLNNEPAKIEQGSSTFVQTVDKNGTPSMTPVSASLKLEVTPSIKSNDNITLKIDASDDSFGTPPSGATSVAINKRTATSKILLKNGETVVIGGIFREQKSDGDSGVPYLKDIPLLGNLFKSSSSLNNREELLIFITPRIINII